jgi:hypothetical protein
MSHERRCPLWTHAADVRFAPETAKLLRCREMTQMGHFLTHASQYEHRYSITSSVRASSDGGTARPRAFAVFR